MLTNVIYYYGLPDRGTRHSKKERVFGNFFFLGFLIISRIPTFIMALLSLLIFGSRNIRRKMITSFGVLVLFGFLAVILSAVLRKLSLEGFYWCYVPLSSVFQGVFGFFGNFAWASTGMGIWQGVTMNSLKNR
jgi:hypothetical protein